MPGLSKTMSDPHSLTTSGSTLVDPTSLSKVIICPGCQLTTTNESGGVVIAFGEFFFHVDCFKCGKCGDKLTSVDTRLLLLSDGHPCCSNCSFKCNLCHQDILDDAISTDDHFYHEGCFKCRSCHNRIEQLVFARTSLGIYCMDCHNRRVSRSRRRAQIQKERDNDIVNGSEGSSFQDGHSFTSNDEDEGEEGAVDGARDEHTPEPETPNNRSAILPPSTPSTPQNPAFPKSERLPHNISTAPAVSETSPPHHTSQFDGVVMPVKPTASFQVSAGSSPPAHNLSQTLPDTHSLTASDSARADPVLPAENEVCKGCQLELKRENDHAVVVTFGNSFFHVDCFKCARCNNRIDSADPVLLVDDQPICASCSYSCNACHEAIIDEALMTGDEVYHPQCFKCRSCHNRIDGLVFARTSYGIYCMDCHNNRVARIRRRAQIQRERANIILDPFERSSLRGEHLDITGDRDGGREDFVANTASAHDVPVSEPKTPVERSAVLPSSTLTTQQSSVSLGPEVRPTNISDVPRLSVSSASFSSSFTSADSVLIPGSSSFPSGPSTYEELMEALRRTHDQHLSTIAAFIGHVHLYSRSSLAAGTGHIYECVKDIVKIACKLLAVVEAVLNHPTVPVHKAANLKLAKDGLYNATSGLAESVRLLTGPLPADMTEEEEKNALIRSATDALKAGADCVAGVKMSLSRSSGEQPFIIERPGDLGEYSASFHSADSAFRSQDQRAVGLGEIQQGAEARFTETTSQATTSTALEGSEDLNTYSRVPGLKLRGKQSNYQRSRQNESSARQIDYNLSNSDDDVDADNDEEKDNFPEEFFDVETGSYNGPRSIKTISKQSFSTWSIFSTDSSRTSKILA